MDTFLAVGAIVTLVALVVILTVHFRKKANNGNSILDIVKFSPETSETLAIMRDQASGISIPIERILATNEIAESSLFEITDRTVIARISATVPVAAEIAAKTISNNALKNVELYSQLTWKVYSIARSSESN